MEPTRLLWLHGTAGVGKTAIAKSLAEHFDSEHPKRLAASFFFDKTGAQNHANSAERFLGTLARQLADFDPAYKDSLFQTINSDRSVLERSDDKRLKPLILNPLNSAANEENAASIPVIILDGLDECGGTRDQELLIKLVIELVNSLPKFQFLLSSRPEAPFQDALTSAYGSELAAINLNDIDPEATLKDIAAYFSMRLDEIPHRGSQPWPPPIEEQEICAGSCGFIFEIAAIRMRIVETSVRLPIIEFRELVEDSKSGFGTYNEEYLRILRKGYPHPDSPVDEQLGGSDLGKLRENRKLIRERFRKIMGAVLGLRDRLSIGPLARLLKLSEADLRSTLRPIHSIVSVPDHERSYGEIAFFHASCREFLLGEPSTGEDNRDFFFDSKGTTLGPPCTELITKTLCTGRPLWFQQTYQKDGGNYYLHDESISYAMQHWMKHFTSDDANSHHQDSLERLSSLGLLAWAETTIIIISFSLWPSEHEKLRTRLNDAHTLLKDNSPWTYDSNDFSKQLRFNWHLPRSQPMSLDTPKSVAEALVNQPWGVERTALSSSGKLVALASQRELRVVNAKSGNLEWDLITHIPGSEPDFPRFQWLEFACNGTRLVGEDRNGGLWLYGASGFLRKYPLNTLPHAGSPSHAKACQCGEFIVRILVEPPKTPWSCSGVVLAISTDDISFHDLDLPNKEHAPLYSPTLEFASIDYLSGLYKPCSHSASDPNLCVAAFDNKLGKRVAFWRVGNGEYLFAYDLIDDDMQYAGEFYYGRPDRKVEVNWLQAMMDVHSNRLQISNRNNNRNLITLPLPFYPSPNGQLKISNLKNSESLDTENGYRVLFGGAPMSLKTAKEAEEFEVSHQAEQDDFETPLLPPIVIDIPWL